MGGLVHGPSKQGGIEAFGCPCATKGLIMTQQLRSARRSSLGNRGTFSVGPEKIALSFPQQIIRVQFMGWVNGQDR